MSYDDWKLQSPPDTPSKHDIRPVEVTVIFTVPLHYDVRSDDDVNNEADMFVITLKNMYNEKYPGIGISGYSICEVEEMEPYKEGEDDGFDPDLGRND
jgi:hypothetical protein